MGKRKYYLSSDGLSEAQTRLVIDHLDYAAGGAKRYHRLSFVTRNGIDMEDLLSAANFGLVQAAMRFNPSLGLKFSTFAFHWIDRELKNEWRKKMQHSGYGWVVVDGSQRFARKVKFVDWPRYPNGKPKDIPDVEERRL